MYHLTYLFCQTKESMTAHLDSPNDIFPESLAAVKCPSFPLATEAPKSPEHEKGKPHTRKRNVTWSPKGPKLQGYLLPTSQKYFHSAFPWEIPSLGLLMPLLSQLGGPCG